MKEKQFNQNVLEDLQEFTEWQKQLIELNYNKKENLQHIFPNYLYYAHLGYTVGSEQAKDRPVLIVDCYNTSPVCVVIPVTLERLNDDKPYHIDLSNTKGTALVEQIRTIDKVRIFDYVYHNKKYATITEEDRTKINEQLSKICQLNPLYIKK